MHKYIRPSLPSSFSVLPVNPIHMKLLRAVSNPRSICIYAGEIPEKFCTNSSLTDAFLGNNYLTGTFTLKGNDN